MASWEVEWTPNEEIITDSYNVYIEWIENDLIKLAGSTSTNKLLVEDIADTASPFRFLIAPVVNGVEATEDMWFPTDTYRPRSQVDLSTPSDLANFTIEQDGLYLVARWDAVSKSEEGFLVEIRRGATWDAGGVECKVSASVGTARWAWSHAEDDAAFFGKMLAQTDRYSANASPVTLSIKGQDDLVVIGTATEETDGGGWAGTKTDVSVDTTKLHPTPIPDWAGDASLWANNAYPWWYKHKAGGEYVTAYIDETTVVRERIEVGLDHEIENVDPGWAGWYGPFLPEFVNGVAVAPGETQWLDEAKWDDGSGNVALMHGMPLEVWIRTTEDDPAGSPTWTAWRRWIPGAFYYFRAYQLKVVFNFVFPFYIPRLVGFFHRRVRRNWKEEQRVTISALGGTTVTFVAPFSAIPVVTCTPITASIPMQANVVDGTESKTGCEIKVFDSGGVERSGIDVNVSILGI